MPAPFRAAFGVWEEEVRLNSLPVRVSLFAGLVIALVFCLGMTFLVQRIGSSVEQQTTELQAETTRSLSEKVSRDLVLAKQAAADIGSATAAMRSAGVLDRASYDSVLQNVLAENPELLATWAAWGRTRSMARMPNLPAWRPGTPPDVSCPTGSAAAGRSCRKC